MLLPALSSAKQKAISIRCSSNLKQIGLAYFMYVQENNQMIGYVYSTGNELNLWMNTIDDGYAGSSNIRICPSASDTNGLAFGQPGTSSRPWSWPTSNPKWRFGSYAINGWLYYWSSTGPIATIRSAADAPKFFQKDSGITRPTDTPAFFDAIFPDTWPQITDLLANDLTAGNSATSLGRCSISRHPLNGGKALAGQPVPGSINMAFADGHVSAWKLRDIKNVVWHVGFTPNPDPWAISP